MNKTTITIHFGTGERRQYTVSEFIEKGIREGAILTLSTKPPRDGNEHFVASIDKRNSKNIETK